MGIEADRQDACTFAENAIREAEMEYSKLPAIVKLQGAKYFEALHAALREVLEAARVAVNWINRRRGSTHENTTKKTIIGTAQCTCCGRDIPVKQSETGTLDVSCQWCELPLYAKAGTEAHRRLMARVKRKADPDPDPVEPVHTPPVEPKPAARAARSAFDILSGRV